MSGFGNGRRHPPTRCFQPAPGGGSAATRLSIASRSTWRSRANHADARDKRVTMHVLRHTAAIRLLHAGIDTSVIALWLGHASPTTTQIYLDADLELKQRALDRTAAPDSRPGRYRPPDTLLAFLKASDVKPLRSSRARPSGRRGQRNAHQHSQPPLSSWLSSCSVMKFVGRRQAGRACPRLSDLDQIGTLATSSSTSRRRSPHEAVRGALDQLVRESCRIRRTTP